MSNQDRIILAFTDRSNWRSWLESNQFDKTEAWLVIQKKSSPDPGLFLDEAVEEALCYGWIDSTLNTRDGRSYLLRFSPRRPNSVWSMKNILRIEKLSEEGLMTETGFAAVQAAQESGEWRAAIERENTDTIPADLEAALNQVPGGMNAYRSLTDSKKKRFVYWLQSAKREDTKQKRLTEIVRLALEEEQ